VQLSQKPVGFLFRREWSAYPSREVALQGVAELEEIKDESEHTVEGEAASAADG
jgi:hypothetical protein